MTNFDAWVKADHWVKDILTSQPHLIGTIAASDSSGTYVAEFISKLHGELMKYAKTQPND
jgi:hypothetical protein